MKRVATSLGVFVALVGLALGGLAQGGDVYGFGFGGGGVAAFWPDLSRVNAVLSENGLGPMPEVLFGGVGSGRGGILVGPSIGGVGFGVTASSIGVDRSAELALGAGGLDLGLAVGGDATSVLTIGAVLGGGASVLELVLPPVQPVGMGPQGIVPEPLARTLGQAFLMAMPYVSFQAQVMPFLGLEVRIGYLLPLVGFEFGDLGTPPSPSMALSGPFVSLSLAVGGVVKGSAGASEEPDAALTGSLELTGVARLEVVNRAGRVVVSSVATGELQTGSARVVQWSATRTGDAAGDEVPTVVAETGPDGATLRSEGEGSVDYVIRVPAGTDLDLASGAGEVRVVGHAAGAIRARLGVGELALLDVEATSLDLSVGVGEIVVSAKQAGALSAHAGIGRVEIVLPPEASAVVSASAGIGATDVTGFPGMSLRERGFLWTQSADAVLGAGDGAISLSVGIGEVTVRARTESAEKPRE